MYLAVVQELVRWSAPCPASYPSWSAPCPCPLLAHPHTLPPCPITDLQTKERKAISYTTMWCRHIITPSPFEYFWGLHFLLNRINCVPGTVTCVKYDKIFTALIVCFKWKTSFWSWRNPMSWRQISTADYSSLIQDKYPSSHFHGFA